MRRVCFFAFAAAVFVATTSVYGEEASCDYRECMNICRNEYEPGCAGMCSRIISLCRQLVPKPERTRSARRSFSPRENIKVNAQARSTPGRINRSDDGDQAIKRANDQEATQALSPFSF